VAFGVKRGVPPGHDALRFKAGKLSALGGSGQRATGISFSGCGGDFGGLFPFVIEEEL